MQPVQSTAPTEDPYKYGWRFVKREGADGSVGLERVPLTLEDVLHPQEEDVFTVRPIHWLDCRYLSTVFDTRSLNPPVSWVAADWRIDWDVPGVAPLQPDLAVFVGLREQPNLQEGTLWRRELGGRCLLVIEVVSPDTRINDAVYKVAYYHRIGVPLYVLIDQLGEEGPRSLVVYRHTPARYELQDLDEQGRVFLPPLNLFLTMRDDRPLCIDAATGRELGDYTRLAKDLEEADRRAQEQDRALEESVTARHSAERKMADEKKAREDAEQKARDEKQAREDAEQKARDERTAFEIRIRQLEEALQRNQGGSPAS